MKHLIALVICITSFLGGVALAQIVEGDHFAPNSTATRCEAITFDWRAAGSPSASAPHTFIDTDIPEWCNPALDWCQSLGICNGVGWQTVDPIPGRSWSYDVEQAIVNAAVKWNINQFEFEMIAACESGGNPEAQSPTNDWGLMQHNANYAPARFAGLGFDFWTTWHDPYINADVAGWLRTTLGYWGYPGGWACADKVGLN